MKMHILSSALLAAYSVLPLVVAKCDKFAIKQRYRSTSGQSYVVTQPQNCTAARARGDGGSDSTCEIHLYEMGLLARPSFKGLDSELKKNAVYSDIISLLRLVSTEVGTIADFNDTIVIKYMAEHDHYSIGQVGVYGATPYTICYNGTISGCEKDVDEDMYDATLLEDAHIEACGLERTTDSSLPLAEQRYMVEETFTLSSTINESSDPEPQPRYEDVEHMASAFATMSAAQGLFEGASLFTLAMVTGYATLVNLY